MGTQFKIFTCLFFITKIIFNQPQNIEFEHLTTEDGLSNNFVISIIQDTSGFMWFGTKSGLNRWDGYQFKIYSNNPYDSNSISNDHVYALYKDSLGTLWVGTEHGLNKFDIQTGKFIRYITHHDSIDFMSQNRVTCIIEDDLSNIWYSTECGICKLNVATGRIERFLEESKDANPPANIVLAIYKIDRERILVGSVKKLSSFNFKSKNFTTINQLKELYLEKYINVDAILIDRKKKLWLGTERGLLSLSLDKEGYEQFINRPKDLFSLSSSGVTALIEDQNRKLWIGTHGGLNLMDRKTKKFISYKNDSFNSKSISSSYIHRIFEDRDQNLWIGSRNKGINIISKWGKHFKSYIHETGNLEGLGYGEVTAIVEDKAGDVWVAQFGGGLNRQNNRSGKFEHYYDLPNSKIKIGNSWVQDVYEDKEGNIWIGSVGLDRINPKNNTVVHYDYDSTSKNGIGGFAINPIYEDKKGILWLGCLANGLDRFDKDKGTFEHYKYNTLDSMSISNNQVLSIFQDNKENLWIGTIDGLCKLIYLKNNKRGFKRFRNNPLNPLSISNNIIYVIFEDSKNRLWIGTENGLNLFNYANECFVRYTKKDGLPSNCVFTILEDDFGNLWLRTDRGLVKFNFERNLFRIYDERDGLLDCRAIDWGHKAFHKGRSGKFYLGGQSRLTVFYPDSIKDNPNPPPIVLTDFKLKNKSVEINDSSYLKKDINYIGSIELPYHENIFSIEFAALDYTAPAKNQYAYKLEGFHDEWTYTDANHHIASYTNLDPGEYTFRVIGSNCDGVWNKIGASLNIIILPPWWATWWFRAIAIIFLAALIYGIYRYRINKLLEMERMRVQIATDLHDDVGASLTKIAVHSEIIQSTEDRKKITSSSAKIGSMSREIITSLSDIVWSIDARNDKIGDLIDRMRDYLETVFPTGNINTDFQTHGLEFDNNLDQALRQNIYLIFKEAVNNAAKHSCATEVNIHMTNGDGKFKLEISDNGKGIELDEKSSGFHGLQNMKLRAERIGGDLKMENINGTRIIFTVKEL